MRYRYQLWRIWDTKKPCVLWIMHNPSIADALIDDPTIRRITNFTKDWGYGGIYVGNMFPYRSTDPKNLLGKPFSEIAPLENIRHINEMKSKCELFILAYGNPIIKDSTPKFFDEDWQALKLTKFGNPCHPLYLKSTLKPQKFMQNRIVIIQTTKRKFELSIDDRQIHRNTVEDAAKDSLLADEVFITWWLK